MMPPSPELPPARVDAARVHAARERVVRLLTDRYADDTLTVEEFEARLDRMHALADPAALDAMARELEAAAPAPLAATPAYAPAYRRAYQASPNAPAPAGGWPNVPTPNVPVSNLPVPNTPAAGGAPDEGRVLAVMSSTTRRGAWAVPRRLHVLAVMGEAVLDLREALLPAACEVEVFALMGNVRIILPAGADAQFEVGAFMAAADDHTRGHYLGTSGTGPRVRVTGLAIMAEVKVVGG